MNEIARSAAPLALSLLLWHPAWAQPTDGGLPSPASKPAADRAGPTSSAARADLAGTWTFGAETPNPSPSAPGSAVLSRTRGPEADDYVIRLVANAASGALATPTVTGTFDGTKLTIRWQPTNGLNARLDAVGGTPRPPAGEAKTLVYAHSEDVEFDRLKLESSAELPGGIEAPKELRRLKPPQVIFPAEWEPSEEILWGYQDTFGASTIYRAALRGCSANGESVKHRFYVASEADRRQLSYEFAEEFGRGGPTGLILYRRAAIGGVWMRDYGPWTVRKKKDNKRAIGDMGYFADRPDDDRMPRDYARLRGWERLDLSSLKIEGGNIMSDGDKRLFTTGRILEGGINGANDSQEAVETSLRRVGAQEVLFFERMDSPEGTGHIDMFAKLMDKQTVLVGRHEDRRWAASLDRNASRFSALGYRVERVDFARPGRVTGVESSGLGLMTYTNSLFVGKTVLVTAYKDRERDAAAAAVYQRLGWKPVMIDVRSIIGANGAIHCISMQVPAR